MGSGTEEQTEKLWADAHRLYNEGDHRGAFERYLTLADQGVAEVQVTLGYLYYSGEGTEKDLGKAEYWLSQAADRSEHEALWYLSQVFLETEDFEAAQRSLENLEKLEGLDREWQLRVLWELAVFHMKRGNDSRALHYLGAVEREDGAMAHWYAGIILDRTGDAGGALQSYEKSAGLGYAPAMYRTGVFYKKGKGVNRDGDKAMALFKEAARNGNARAEATYAKMLIGGKEGIGGILRGLLLLVRNPFNRARIAFHDIDDDRLRG